MKVDTKMPKSFVLKGKCIQFLSMQHIRYLCFFLFQIKFGTTFEDLLTL